MRLFERTVKAKKGFEYSFGGSVEPSGGPSRARGGPKKLSGASEKLHVRLYCVFTAKSVVKKVSRRAGLGTS